MRNGPTHHAKSRLWEKLTVRCERHCVLRKERLVEVSHNLKEPRKKMRDSLSVCGIKLMKAGNSPAAANQQLAH